MRLGTELWRCFAVTQLGLSVSDKITQHHLVVDLIAYIFEWAVPGGTLSIFRSKCDRLVKCRSFIWNLWTVFDVIFQLQRLRHYLLRLPQITLRTLPCLGLLKLKKHPSLVWIPQLRWCPHLLHPPQTYPVVHYLPRRSLRLALLSHLDRIIVWSLCLKASH